MKDVKDASMVGYTSEGRTIRRPLSPHLSVYRPQMTSVLSIMNRVTGLAISAGTLLLVWWLVAAAAGPGPYATVQWFVGSPIGLFMLFGWTASLFYHFYAGIRHLAWDSGWGYELDRTYITGWATIIATLVTTVLVWGIGLYMMPGR